MKLLYPFLNLFFHVLHACVILFTLFGWLWPPWRLYHLVWILLTLGSWYGLGLWMGMGYCPVTDLHWTIKQKLGKGRPQCNYLYYCSAKIPHLTLDKGLVDKVTLGATLLVGIISLILNAKHYLF
jgi:hypothetical protein